MYVCVCNAVTESHIARAIEDGARHLRDLRATLGVTAECGRCAKCAKACIHKTLGSEPGCGVPSSIEQFPLVMEA